MDVVHEVLQLTPKAKFPMVLTSETANTHLVHLLGHG